MISICIPVFNRRVVEFVCALREGAADYGIEVEVLVFDDCSELQTRRQNRALEGTPGVVYLELPYNMGRSLIRNCLIDCARGEWLLFLDCDMFHQGCGAYLHSFIEEARRTHCDVVCGGVEYGAKPQNRDELLRWNAEQRRAGAYARVLRSGRITHLTTGNLFVRRDLIERIRFDESLHGYGHDDTVLYLELMRRGIEVRCIDNKIEHQGGESNEIFISKAKESVVNLVRLWHQREDLRPKLLSISPRLRVACSLLGIGFGWLLLGLHRAFSGRVYERLRVGSLGMFFFDFYLIGFMLQALRVANLDVLAKRHGLGARI